MCQCSTRFFKRYSLTDSNNWVVSIIFLKNAKYRVEKSCQLWTEPSAQCNNVIFLVWWGMCRDWFFRGSGATADLCTARSCSVRFRKKNRTLLNQRGINRPFTRKYKLEIHFLTIKTCMRPLKSVFRFDILPYFKIKLKYIAYLELFSSVPIPPSPFSSNKNYFILHL